MEFNSQICTTKEQSEQLLTLGLKKETADMCINLLHELVYSFSYSEALTLHKNYGLGKITETDLLLPAWSLHRLIEMMPKEIFHESKQWHLFLSLCYEDAISYEECDSSKPCYLHFCSSYNIYDNIIESIEWLIKEGYFNKEYLN